MDDAVGAAHGERGGIVVLLPAAGELAGVNFGAKAVRGRRGIERTTRSVGDDAESRREAALPGALTVVPPDGGGGVPAGANPVPWLRCARLSGWFDDYWDERLRQAA